MYLFCVCRLFPGAARPSAAVVVPVLRHTAALGVPCCVRTMAVHRPRWRSSGRTTTQRDSAIVMRPCLPIGKKTFIALPLCSLSVPSAMIARAVYTWPTSTMPESKEAGDLGGSVLGTYFVARRLDFLPRWLRCCVFWVLCSRVLWMKRALVFFFQLVFCTLYSVHLRSWFTSSSSRESMGIMILLRVFLNCDMESCSV